MRLVDEIKAWGEDSTAKLKRIEEGIADLQAALQQAQEERNALRRRFTGNREECGHLRRFICGQGTMVEHCVVCVAEAAERELTEQRALVEDLQAAVRQGRTMGRCGRLSPHKSHPSVGFYCVGELKCAPAEAQKDEE